MPQQMTPRIQTPAKKGKVGAGGGQAVLERIVQNGRGGRFAGTGTLTAKQKAFVRDYVRNGGNGQKALRSAGYQTAHPSKAVYRLMSCPIVRHAIHQERKKLLGGRMATNALAVLNELMNDPDTPAPVRYQTARTVLQLAGHGVGREEGSPPDVNQPLVEMSVQELQAFVRDGEALLRVAAAAKMYESEAKMQERAVVETTAWASDPNEA